MRRTALPLLYLHICTATSPYRKTSLTGWKYFFENDGGSETPCADRFLSRETDCGSHKVDVFGGKGDNQMWTLEAVDAFLQIYRIKSSCGYALSYSRNCGELKVFHGTPAGNSELFQLHDTPQGFGWLIETWDRLPRPGEHHGCDERFIAMPLNYCPKGEQLLLRSHSDESHEGTWYFHAAVAQPDMVSIPSSRDPCADPFLWKTSNKEFFAMCTAGPGGDFQLLKHVPAAGTNDLTAGSYFESLHAEARVLGGTKSRWAYPPHRWAPENVELPGGENMVLFSVAQPSDGKHRMGWALSRSGVKSGAWNEYSADVLDLGKPLGGVIDPNIFTDTDGKTYLLWKADDNAPPLESPICRIFIQEITISKSGIELKEGRREITDSTGLWWINSFVKGGALLEGPELIKRGGTYYLFFATGQYCQDSYAEGVARANHVFGPYEKMRVPLLSTQMVGYAPNGVRIVGPGHAAYTQDLAGNWWVMYHAGVGNGCLPGNPSRFAYHAPIFWSDDGWPFVDLVTVLGPIGLWHIEIKADPDQHKERRYLSWTADGVSVDLWHGKGAEQTITMEPHGFGVYSMRTQLDPPRWLSYSSDCSQRHLDTWREQGENQKFYIEREPNAEAFLLMAVGRFNSNCADRYLGWGVKRDDHGISFVTLDRQNGRSPEWTFERADHLRPSFDPVSLPDTTSQEEMDAQPRNARLVINRLDLPEVIPPEVPARDVAPDNRLPTPGSRNLSTGSASVDFHSIYSPETSISISVNQPVTRALRADLTEPILDLDVQGLNEQGFRLNAAEKVSRQGALAEETASAVIAAHGEVSPQRRKAVMREGKGSI